MTRPLIIDTFPAFNELHHLEMRLETMDEAVDFFVCVEADVDHQNHPKPFHITENIDRFAAWADKLIVIRATGLPTLAQDNDPWARELAQRGYVAEGLRRIHKLHPLSDSDIVLHGDLDEVCRPLAVRNVRPPADGFVSFGQRLHCFAVDWLHPDPWGGTVAATLAQVAKLRQINREPFMTIRNSRNSNDDVIADAGWHFSWLGGKEAALAKLGAFCHPEIAERALMGLTEDIYLREGFHVDGRRMKPVEVTPGEWPAYISDRRCPSEWFRPR